MVIRYLKKPLSYFQISLLYISYNFFFLIKKNKKIKNSWVIGVDEIASIIFFLKDIIKPSVSVSFSKNKFYKWEYNYSITIENIYLRHLIRLFYGPLLLGYLATKNTNFWYIWSSGFLIDRDIEFKFLKKKNKKIFITFCGSDIRSIKLTNAHARDNKLDTHTHYMIYKHMQDPYYELEKQDLAMSADKHADIIFNFKICQMSYLKSKQYTFPYLIDKNKFKKDNQKFKNLGIIKILHAPSSVFIKGTSLVRAAIKKLEIENYNFEYTELLNVPNQTVLDHLNLSHIALNQFYAFTPGYFGIEAMANHCAVLMSADPSIETGLPKNYEDAWLITRYWEIYDNLKFLLDNPDKIKYYADNGYDFAYKNYTYEAVKEYLDKLFKEKNIISQ